MKQRLTQEELEAAIAELPKHRTNLIRSAKNTLDLVRRGIPIYTDAPIWRQVQNVVFVSKIDIEIETEATT